MAEESFQEKTEQATPRKREKTREEGQVAKSMEVVSVTVLLAGASALYVSALFFHNEILTLMRSGFSFDSIPDMNPASGLALVYDYSGKFFLIVFPFMAVVVVAALAMNFFQVGFEVSWKAVKPRFDKLDVIKGFGRLFSLKALAELVKSILKLVIIYLVAWYILSGQAQDIFTLYDASVAQILIYILKTSFKLLIWVTAIMAVLAALDYGFQKWQFEKQIRMTRQEIKEEFKQTEGDPQIKSRIRSIQIQAARKRMMKQVPEADVVVTNPTHLAIAITYKPLEMAAPKVVAKGAGYVAERIKKIAAEHHIPVVENKELARNLYKTVEAGEQIPSELYKAVAELLAYVYKLKGKRI